MNTCQKILVLLGPTAVGKSALAVRLALKLQGEIVSADSRQVYKYMDIGTGKISFNERANIPHHLIDVVEPDENYNLALFLLQAHSTINHIQSRSKIPIVVGGTGQYIRGLVEGWRVPHVAPDLDLRKKLEVKARKLGPDELHRILAKLDPTTACRIDPRNVRRTIRALEVRTNIQKTLPDKPKTIVLPFQPILFGLTLDRDSLYQRADSRINHMINSGWVTEVEDLIKRGYSLELPSMSSLGYKEISQYLEGEKSLEEAISKIKQRTRRLVRQQYSWFQLSDQNIHWYDSSPAGLKAAEIRALAIFK